MGATQAKLAALQSNLDRDHLLPDRCTPGLETAISQG